MGFKKFFGTGEDKGIECEIGQQDGIPNAVCKRTKKMKDGSNVTDGQEIHVYADPSTDCSPSYSGHLSVQDDDGFKAFDEISKKVVRGCKRASKRGLVNQPVK